MAILLIFLFLIIISCCIGFYLGKRKNIKAKQRDTIQKNQIKELDKEESLEWQCKNCGCININKFCQQCGNKKEEGIYIGKHLYQ